MSFPPTPLYLAEILGLKTVVMFLICKKGIVYFLQNKNSLKDQS